MTSDHNNALCAAFCVCWGLVFLIVGSPGCVVMFGLAALNVWVIGRKP